MVGVGLGVGTTGVGVGVGVGVGNPQTALQQYWTESIPIKSEFAPVAPASPAK